MADFELKIAIADNSDGTVISSIQITGKDGEVLLDKGISFAYIYPDELIRLGKWDGFAGFKLTTEYIGG